MDLQGTLATASATAMAYVDQFILPFATQLQEAFPG
jgi:hypothetical protein